MRQDQELRPDTLPRMEQASKECIWGNRVTNRDEKQTISRLPCEELLVSLSPSIYM